MDLKIQFELLLYSFLIGIYLGVTYDVLYYFIFIHLKKAIKYVCDVLYFFIQGFIVFQVIYKINYGIIPLYCYVFFGIGFFIYYSYSQRYYEQNLYPLRKLVYYFLRKMYRVFKYLFVKPFVDTYHFILPPFQYIGKKIKGLYDYVKKKIIRRKKTKKDKKDENKT